jgi:CheY-like chemotaxis protein
MSSPEFEVESAKDGLDAFHKLAKTYFDLIITDIQMRDWRSGSGSTAENDPTMGSDRCRSVKKIKRKERRILNRRPIFAWRSPTP